MTGLLGTYFPAEDPMAPVDLMPRGLLGPSVLGRMQAHSDAQRQRMAAGDYSPTPMDEESMWLADDLAGGLLGSLPGGLMMLGARGTSKADAIARLLREGRAAEVTDEMLGALGPNEQAKLFDLYESGATGMDLPMDEASRMARAKEQGHSPGMFHGTASDIRKFQPPDARNSLGTHMGTAEAANERLGGRHSAFEKRMMEKRGMADPENIVAVTRRNESPLDMEDMIHWAPEDVAARLSYLRAAEGLGINQVPRRSYQGAEFYDNRDIVNELSGAGYTGMRYSNAIEDAGSTSEVVFDPANIRSRHARFDPRLSKNADLLASMGGLGILGATQLYPYIEGVE